MPHARVRWSLAVSVPVFAVLVPLLSCASSGAERPASLMKGDGGVDTLVTPKETFKGKIVYADGSQVRMETDRGITVIPTATIVNAHLTAETERRWFPRAGASPEVAPPSTDAPSSSSWYRRHDSKVAVREELIDWHYDHDAAAACIGREALKHLEATPELVLHAPPGGKVVFHDFRNYGYHAHAWPKGLYQASPDSPGLAIPIPEKDAPTALAFVSFAAEYSTLEKHSKSSWVPPDVIYALLKGAEGRDQALRQQLFAGGGPSTTALGHLTAFALPKDLESFYIYLADDEKKSHAKVLAGTFAVFGTAILEPSAVIAVHDADGSLSARILNVPYPPKGERPAPLSICTGTPEDAVPLTTLPNLPPRMDLVLPESAPRTKADLWIHAHDAASELPQRLLVVHGTGVSTAADTVVQEQSPLTAENAAVKVTIDVSAGRKEEDYPVCAWATVKRTYAWKTTGGRFAPGSVLARPAAPSSIRTTRVIRMAPSSHAIPLRFVGPNPPAASSGGSAPVLGSGFADGMARDALLRDAGTLFNPVITTPLGTSGGSTSNNMNVTIIVPPPSTTGSLGGSAAPNLSGQYLRTWGTSNVGLLPGGPGGAYGNTIGTNNALTGVYKSPSGATVYDPNAPGAWNYYSDPSSQGATSISLDPITGRPNIPISRRNRP